MVKHNNAIPNQHFHKKWQRRVKTWLDQPKQKKVRRELRKVKAAAIAPRPVSGALRPLVHCPTQKYNTKVKLGRGFTLEELKAAGINAKYAQTVGIAVDHRRTNKCNESLSLNVDRLKDYKTRLVVFPRDNSRAKKRPGYIGKQAFKDAIGSTASDVNGKVTSAPTVTFVAAASIDKSAKGYGKLRHERNEAKLLGVREKRKKEGKDDEKPAAAAAPADD